MGFLRREIRTVQDIAQRDLCSGCGACSYICPAGAVSLINIPSAGIRPLVRSADCRATCRDCLDICPGYAVDGGLATGERAAPNGAVPALGPALEVWEGFASDAEIRYRGSSGGILTAIALYCLERERMSSVLHTGANPAEPCLNRTVESRTRADLLAHTGSRYAPASPCDGLAKIEASAGSCVFIGKPCDTAALAKSRQLRPELDRKLGLVLTFFCAGTPSTLGTLDLLKDLGMPHRQIESLRYRGEGWPGAFKVRSRADGSDRSLAYEQAWGRLTAFRPWRCLICPDGLGRVADISCGDAWERLGSSDGNGVSVVVVRTPRGREILHQARAAKYVDLEPASASVVRAAQAHQIQRHREVLGRLRGMRLLLRSTPHFVGFSLDSSWDELSIPKKARTILGTARRLLTRGRRLPY